MAAPSELLPARVATTELSESERPSPKGAHADADAECIGHEGHKCGFFIQVSDESCLSSVSTTYSLEELSSPAFFSHQCTEIDAMASKVLDERSIKEAFCAAVMKDSQFCVSIADPRSKDVPLIAVSEKFETITGYGRAEVLGKNCRFLNTGCGVDPVDLMRLRTACETGEAFTGVLTNRRKSGDYFLNLLDLRGLTVARNPSTGEELWFLVGIQADVTDIGMIDVPEDQSAALHEIASGIRCKLAVELSAMAVAGALMGDFGVADPGVPCPDKWCLLPMPSWRFGDDFALSEAVSASKPQVEATSRQYLASASVGAALSGVFMTRLLRLRGVFR